MRYDFLLAVLLFGVGTFFLFWIVYIFTRKELMIGIKLLGLFMLACCFFIFGYGGFILSDSVDSMLLFNHLQYIGIPFVFVCWYFLSVMQKNRNRKIAVKHVVCLLIVPIFALVTNFLYLWKDGVATSWVRQLYFVSHVLVGNIQIGSGFQTLLFEKGVFYYILMGYNLLLMGISGYNFFLVYKSANAAHRKKILHLVFLTGFAFLSIAYSFLNKQTAYLDMAPFITVFFVIGAFLALYKYEFFDLIPLAYRNVFQGVEFPVFILDRSMTLISANVNAKNMFTEQFDFRNVLSIEDFDRIDSDFSKDLLEKGEHETWMDIDGEVRYFFVKLLPLSQNGGRLIGYLLQYNDITHHKLEMKKMEQIATYDDLTKILNRRVFYLKAQEAFDEAIQNKSCFSIIMFDLDDFKEVNDIYGHQTGDYLLAKMAELIRAHLHENDLFARYGGEEFIIYSIDKPPAMASVLAETLRKALADNIFVHDNHKIKITASFGVAGCDGKISKSFEHYIKDSDIGLYQAKDAGKNKIVMIQ